MAKGKKTGGRVTGTPNRLSTTVKDNVIAVFDGIGGIETMQRWARSNAGDFYKIYSKLIPTDLTIDPNANTITVLVKNFGDKT